MIDQIEELLARLAAKDEEEREDVPARKCGDVVSSGLSSERSKSGEAPEGRTAFAESESLGRVANRRSVTTEKRGKAVGEGAWTGARASDGASGPRDQPETEGKRPSDLTALQRDNITVKPRIANRRSVTTGETASEQPELMTGGLWRVGPIWGALVSTMSPALENVGRGGPEQAGLGGLYRQTVRGLRPAAPALPPEQAGRTVRAREPGSAASLAVDELDRAVRRDSRRYDGGMSIY